MHAQLTHARTQGNSQEEYFFLLLEVPDFNLDQLVNASAITPSDQIFSDRARR
jgi:hypothetical protein